MDLTLKLLRDLDMCIPGWMYYHVPPSMIAVMNRQDHMFRIITFRKLTVLILMELGFGWQALHKQLPFWV